MEVGEEGERKGEVNRSEVKWNAPRTRSELVALAALSPREEREEQQRLETFRERERD